MVGASRAATRTLTTSSSSQKSSSTSNTGGGGLSLLSLSLSDNCPTFPEVFVVSPATSRTYPAFSSYAATLVAVTETEFEPAPASSAPSTLPTKPTPIPPPPRVGVPRMGGLGGRPVPRMNAPVVPKTNSATSRLSRP